MALIICNTAHKSVTIPLGAGLYAGGCYLSRFIPQALVAGLFNKAPTALVSLVARITTTLGRGLHVVGAIAFIVAVHQIASRCSLKHAVQSGFRHYLQAADNSAQRNEALEGLPWDLMQMLPIKDVQAMLMGVNVTIKGNSAPLINSLSRVLWFKIAGLLEAEGTLEGKMSFLTWLLSGNEEDQTLVSTLPEGHKYFWFKLPKYRQCVLDLMDVPGNDAMVAKLLTWITGVSFEAADEGLATAADRVNAYIQQLKEVNSQASRSVAELFVAKGARLGVLQKALAENSGGNWTHSETKGDFETFASSLATNEIQSAVHYESDTCNVIIDEARLERAHTILQDTNVHVLRDTDVDLSGLVGNLLTPGKEQWVLAAWLMGQAPLKPGTIEPLPFSEWTLDNCRQRIYDCWSAQDQEGSLLEAEFLMAILLAKQQLPLFDSQEAAAQHRARCLNTLSMASSDVLFPVLICAIQHLYPEGTKEALGARLLDMMLNVKEINLNFIVALIRAGATPPPLGAWQDPNLLEVVKHLAESNGSNDVLTWLTGIHFDPVKTPDLFLLEAYTRWVERITDKSSDLTDGNKNLLEVCVHFTAWCADCSQLASSPTCAEANFTEAKVDVASYALKRIKELEGDLDRQKYHVGALKALLKDRSTLEGLCKASLEQLMEVRFLGKSEDELHSILTYLVEEGKLDLAAQVLGVLDEDKSQKKLKEELIKDFVNYQAKVCEKTAPTQDEAAGAGVVKERSALRMLTVNVNPEEYSADHHRVLTRLIILGAEIPADVLLFQGAVDWFCGQLEPLADTLKDICSKLKYSHGLTEVSKEALALYPGDTKENAKVHALERCKLYAAALQALYPLLNETLLSLASPAV